MNIGYACINTELSNKMITTNRGMKLGTFKTKGLDYVSELALKNVTDLNTLIEWNIKNGINVFRMSSDLIPWFSEINLDELKDYELIYDILKQIGKKCKEYNHRVSFHPGPFNCLGSPKEDVVIKTINEINKHSYLMDIMGLEKSPWNKINIHLGGAYGDKVAAANRFCKNLKFLSLSAQSRLTIENDDKDSLYTVNDLYHLVYKKIKIPIVFDYLHHQCHNGGMNECEALGIAISTWNGVKPVTHYSSSKKLFENSKYKLQAHADFLYDNINTWGHDIDIIIEAKAKEQALINFRNKFQIL